MKIKTPKTNKEWAYFFLKNPEFLDHQLKQLKKHMDDVLIKKIAEKHE